MKLLKVSLFLLCICLISGSALADELAVKDGLAVVIDSNGAEFPIPGDSIEALKVDNSDLTFIALDEGQSVRLTEFGIKPGVYFFNASGKMFAHFVFEFTEICSAASLSPEQNIIALDSGTWVMRDWHFFSFPDFTPLGKEGVSYYSTGESPDLIWINDNEVLYTSLKDMNEERKCDYDPCGATSVSIYELSSDSSFPLREGTVLCDYRLEGFEDGVIHSIEYCREKPEDWSAPESDPEGFPVTDAPPVG